jgi:type II secretory ATPase GspE/PulE/Tfp pilus assembly ATPase PilB-like protein
MMLADPAKISNTRTVADAAGEKLDISIPCSRYRIVPREQSGCEGVLRFYIEEGRDCLEIAHELRFIWGLDAMFVQTPLEEFAKHWESFTATLPKGDCACDGADVFQNVGVEPSALSRMLGNVFIRAVNSTASDIHFESLESAFLIRTRVDGTLREEVRLPAEMLAPLSVLLKTLAKLDIAEHFMPQDGRFGLKIGGVSVDFRISVLPTKFGESIVLRVLDRRRLFHGLGDLSIDPATVSRIRGAISAQSGLFLVTGPTGSGKTTTLYAALGEMDRGSIKVLTIEDPIEYELQNCMQASVDLPIGRTFSAVLRSFLRHDPDKIFIGEVRDEETAQIALRAALTGHLVISTLHTATPQEAIVRLVEMGLEKNLLISCLRGVLNQRLLRRNCAHCSTEHVVDGKLPQQLNMLNGKKLRRGTGCKHCGGSGYEGRRAFFEFLSIEELTTDSNCHLGTMVAEGLEAVIGGDIALEEFMNQMPWNR